MTPEIKERIKTIQAGHVPDDYKRSKIGIVPVEWSDYSFSSLFVDHSDYTENLDEFPLYSLTIEDGVTKKTERYERGHLVKKDEAYKKVFPNDFVYNPMNVRFGAVARHKGTSVVSVSGYYDTFSTLVHSDMFFMDYFLVSEKMISYYNAMSTGSLVEKQRVHYSQFKDFCLPLPSEPERIKIAEILSTQDKIIKLKEKLLEQKQEQKKYLVKKIMFASDEHNAVLADIIDLISIRSCASQNCYVSTENMISNYGGIIFSEEGQIVEGIAFRKDDILVGNIRPYLKKVWRASIDGVCSADVLVFRAKKAIPLYLYYLVANDTFCEYVMNGVKGTKMPRGDKKQILQMPLFIPPISEQQTIAEVLSTADKEIDLLKAEIEQEKLKKKSLMQLLLTGIVRVKV